jgi:hypothetical protein
MAAPRAGFLASPVRIRVFLFLQQGTAVLHTEQFATVFLNGRRWRSLPDKMADCGAARFSSI